MSRRDRLCPECVKLQMPSCQICHGTGVQRFPREGDLVVFVKGRGARERNLRSDRRTRWTVEGDAGGPGEFGWEEDVVVRSPKGVRRQAWAWHLVVVRSAEERVADALMAP